MLHLGYIILHFVLHIILYIILLTVLNVNIILVHNTTKLNAYYTIHYII